MDIISQSESIVNKSSSFQYVIELKIKGRITSFEPMTFMKIRQICGIKEDEIIQSLDPINNREQIFKSNLLTSRGKTTNTGGKSGSFFFYSQDKKFIIKTIKPSERKQLIKMLLKLCDHMQSHKSYLALIVGIFEIKLQSFKTVEVMVMKNSVIN